MKIVVTGEGLAEALTGAQDVFTTATGNALTEAESRPDATVFPARFEDWLVDNTPVPVR
jgi:hypothetical protein